MTYKTHEELFAPSQEQELWKYMDLPKFLSMIQTSSLYFPSLKQFELSDPWEGLVSKQNFAPSRKISVHTIADSSSLIDINNPSNKIETMTLQEAIGEGFEKYVESAKLVRLNAQKYMFVNCWHMNNTDSDSQWKIYGNNDYSLAITTNFEKLKNAINDERWIYGSDIIYYDPKKYEVPDSNMFFPVIHKRHSFSHEKEFRLIHMSSDFVQKPDEAPPGLNISVDLGNLIEKVIISPRAPTWFKESIELLMQKYNLDHTCVKSDLLEHPFT